MEINKKVQYDLVGKHHTIFDVVGKPYIYYVDIPFIIEESMLVNNLYYSVTAINPDVEKVLTFSGLKDVQWIM